MKRYGYNICMICSSHQFIYALSVFYLTFIEQGEY